jgi:hypothetical protein
MRANSTRYILFYTEDYESEQYRYQVYSVLHICYDSFQKCFCNIFVSVDAEENDIQTS